MDVLIVMVPPPYVEDETIWVDFVAIGRISNGEMPQLNFRVAFQFGATLPAKRTAIVRAANAAAAAYEAAHDVTLPAVTGIEILGI